MHIQKPGHFKKMYPLAAASCCCRLKSLKASKDYRHGHFTRLLHLHVFKEISFLEFSSLALHFQNIIWILLLSEFWFWSSQEKTDSQTCKFRSGEITNTRKWWICLLHWHHDQVLYMGTAGTESKGQSLIKQKINTVMQSGWHRSHVIEVELFFKSLFTHSYVSILFF